MELRVTTAVTFHSSTSACTLGEFLAIGMVELTYQAIVESRPARRRIALGVRSSTDPRPIVTDDAP